MKILPLKPMSNFDKFDNFMKIVEFHKHAHTTPVSDKEFCSQFSTKTQNITGENTRENIFCKYRTKISEIIKGIKKNNG